MKRYHILSIIKISLFLLLVIIIISSYYLHIITGFSIPIFKDFILSYGDYSWIMALLLVIVFVSIGLPVGIPTILVSLLFNLVTAFLLVCLGIYIGAVFSFFIARWLGKEYLEKKFINKIGYLKSWDNKLYNNGFYILLLSRFIFIIPFEFVNLIAGVSKIKFKDYITATIIGVIPGTILIIYLIQQANSIYSPQFIFASLLYLLMTLIPLLSKRIRGLAFNV